MSVFLVLTNHILSIILHRRRKVLNMGGGGGGRGGKVQNIRGGGAEGGGQTFRWLLTDRGPWPPSVPNSCISHIEN